MVVEQVEGRETACNPAITDSESSGWGAVIGQAEDLDVREWTGRPEELEKGVRRVRRGGSLRESCSSWDS